MARDATLIAFDLGAGSGRAMLGKLRGGLLSVEEIHRFVNDPVRYNNELHWDMPAIWREIHEALVSRAGHSADPVHSIGVDAWGVDYALLGEHGALLENPYHYRDARTDGVMERMLHVIARERVYDITGIQFMPINTLYQLYAAAQRRPKLLAAAESLVTIPDLVNFWLTGTVACEYTNATTTQLLDRRTGRWSAELLEAAGIPAGLPARVIEPGTVLGALIPEFAAQPALAATEVVAPACHDTGSAVAAVATGGSTAFLSCGTWSLLGTEVSAPVVTPDALRLNFTNEGGVCGTIRLLKNITGLWLLAGCRRAWEKQGHTYKWEALVEMSAGEEPFRHLVDPDAPLFVRPEYMTAAIDDYCRHTGQPVPATPGAYVRAVLESLALKYRMVLEQLESLTGSSIAAIRIIGGGSQNALLNQFTADATARDVLAGPAESTALGNMAMQMVATRLVASLGDAREMIERSFPPRKFHPSNPQAWDAAYSRFRAMCGGSANIVGKP